MGSLPCTSCVIQQPDSHVMAELIIVYFKPGLGWAGLRPREAILFMSCKIISTDLLSDSSDVKMLRTQLDIPDDRQAPKIINSKF